MIETRSRPVNWFRVNTHPAYRAVLATIMHDLDAQEHRTRGRGAAHADFENAVSALVLDLYAATISDPDMTVGVSKANSTYADRSLYRPGFLTWSIFKDTFGGLLRAGYIAVVTKGSYNRENGNGRVTRIASTAKLANMLAPVSETVTATTVLNADEMQTVVLRDQNKRQVEYRDNRAIRAMRANLQTINALFQQHWFDVWIPDSEYDQLNRRIRSKTAQNGPWRVDPDYQPSVHIDLSRRSIVRIFNDKDWNKGGRFYGGWWQSVPKSYRPYITIDDKQTVELDYSHLHPALLYAKEGMALDRDAYEIGLPAVPRDIVKRTFNAMLNASERLNPIEGFDSRQFDISWEQLQQQIIARHEPIRKYFKSKHGLYLQREDSDLAEDIMLRFAVMGYPCLPVHDSFIIHHDLEDELQSAMHESFHKRTGIQVKTKAKKHDYADLANGALDMSDPLIALTGPYSGYNKRLAAFRENIN
ncbi:hypothetical protein ELH62_15315 [Rhizobium ruizarguesonis]|uniref:hypothetical protein n=1 Tax=Rhizobium ruizarguesonis TaxID=2081791 RepID=UPI00103279D4|nr:hypothetical protein [Rhizobium ruizarguesonis]TBA43655.1 hypothetical protein ELH62_15315 [Rhizobium ruizarguesonis]